MIILATRGSKPRVAKIVTTVDLRNGLGLCEKAGDMGPLAFRDFSSGISPLSFLISAMNIGVSRGFLWDKTRDIKIIDGDAA